MAGAGLFIDVTGGMVLGTHPERPQLPVAVAPTDGDGKGLNTIRAPLVTIACWKLPDHFFAFDSSVIAPDAKNGFAQFIQLRRQLADAKTGAAPPLSIFGHADPVGDDAYNTVLSSRRAAAVYGLLVRDLDLWDFLFTNRQICLGDDWGQRSLQVMLGAVPDAAGAPYYDGPADGVMSVGWSDAVHRFQEDHQPDSITGTALDAKHRKPIFAAYMDVVCVDPDGAPYTLAKTEDFLARGKGQNARGDVQGCGEFNPALIFAKGETFASKEERNQANRPNRRVVVYLFRPGTEIDPSDTKKGWPCPAFKQDAGSAMAACTARFWKDGADRRTRQEDERREFRHKEDTFACRFYHGFAARSVCEGILQLWQIRLATRGADHKLQPLANVKCVATLGAEADAALIRTASDDDGRVHLPVLDDKTTMTLRIDNLGVAGAPADPAASGDPEAESGESQFLPLVLDAGALVDLPAFANDDLAVKQRLHNLGFGPGQLASWTDDDLRRAVRAFRKMHHPPLPLGDSADDDDFRKALRDEYGDNDVPLAPPEDG
jgi:outer membrane protein OmpA-like peptidoglycan-associated protein